MGNKVNLRDLGPGGGFSRNFRALGGDTVVLRPERIAWRLGDSGQENTLGGGLQEWEFGN